MASSPGSLMCSQHGLLSDSCPPSAGACELCLCVVACSTWMVMKREAAEITPMSEGENGAIIKSNRTVARQSRFRNKRPKAMWD